MNKEAMERMSASELEEYARALGVSAKAAKSAKDKAELIEKRRSRVATVRVLGMDLDIPVKRMRDKRVTDLASKAASDDDAAVECMRLILGDDQFAQVEAACTDDDGTVDVTALSVAYVRVTTAKELKNF